MLWTALHQAARLPLVSWPPARARSGLILRWAAKCTASRKCQDLWIRCGADDRQNRSLGTPHAEEGGVQPRAATRIAPAAIITMPTQLRTSNRSPKNTTPNTATSRTLNLSMGATPDAGPIFSAR